MRSMPHSSAVKLTPKILRPDPTFPSSLPQWQHIILNNACLAKKIRADSAVNKITLSKYSQKIYTPVVFLQQINKNGHPKVSVLTSCQLTPQSGQAIRRIRPSLYR
jgi:hypothetical protein